MQTKAAGAPRTPRLKRRSRRRRRLLKGRGSTYAALVKHVSNNIKPTNIRMRFARVYSRSLASKISSSPPIVQSRILRRIQPLTIRISPKKDRPQKAALSLQKRGCFLAEFSVGAAQVQMCGARAHMTAPGEVLGRHFLFFFTVFQFSNF